MIDQNSRSILAQNRKTQTLVSAMKDIIASSLKSGNPNEEVLKLVVKREDEPKLLEQVGKIGQALAMVYKVITKPFPLPKIFQVKGQVEVIRNAPVKITNLSELEKYFKSLEQRIITLAQAASLAPAPQIKIPDFPKIQIPKIDNSKLEILIENLVEKINTGTKEIKFPRTIEVSNFPIARTPQPVTNININPLRGIVKTTSVTVGTGLTKLPSYGQLPMRRSLILFNNSSNTIYYGGSDVTTSNGTPVLTQTYSPSIDAGYDMVIYGIASQGGNDVRVMEVSSTTQEVGTSMT